MPIARPLRGSPRRCSHLRSTSLRRTVESHLGARCPAIGSCRARTQGRERLRRSPLGRCRSHRRRSVVQPAWRSRLPPHGCSGNSRLRTTQRFAVRLPSPVAGRRRNRCPRAPLSRDNRRSRPRFRAYRAERDLRRRRMRRTRVASTRLDGLPVRPRLDPSSRGGPCGRALRRCDPTTPARGRHPHRHDTRALARQPDLVAPLLFDGIASQPVSGSSQRKMWLPAGGYFPALSRQGPKQATTAKSATNQD